MGKMEERYIAFGNKSGQLAIHYIHVYALFAMHTQPVLRTTFTTLSNFTPTYSYSYFLQYTLGNEIMLATQETRKCNVFQNMFATFH